MRVARDPFKEAAVDAGHRGGARRAAPVDGGEQPQPAAVPLTGAVGLELHQVGEPGLHGLGWERLRRAERRELDAELVQVFLRQVDAVVEEVLANVAQDVRQLEGDTEVVGHLVLALWVRDAVDAEAEAANAARDAAAVPEQVVERLVGRLVDVGEAAVNELLERLKRHLEAAAGVSERHEHGIRVVQGDPAVALDPGDQGPHLLPGDFQLRRLLPGRQVTVADVIDPARVGVDRGEGTALVRRQQPDAVGKVPCLLPGDLLALGVGLVGVHRHLPLK